MGVLTLWITWYILWALKINNRAVVPLMGLSLTGAERSNGVCVKSIITGILKYSC